MVRRPKQRGTNNQLKSIRKCPTGIAGLDEITGGGLPAGRPTLICGGAGAGKTLLAMEFMVRGATQFNEPGVFMCFEETEKELAANVASLGFEVPKLVRQNKLAIDHVHVERSEFEETGEYDLEGLFVRLGAQIDQVKAKRVVLDSLEALFSSLPNEAILRAELRRLFRWLKGKGVTVLITGERGMDPASLTRYGIEEYVSDCVIVLDHRVVNQIATRRLRVVKYRGSAHGTNEYPAMIDETGLSVLPISSLGLEYPVTTERVSSGVPRLDAMLGGKGYYQGSSILISGTAGTGKSSLAVAFADSICRKGGTALYFSLEESPDQIIRNMASIGFDLGRHVKAGRLKMHSVRPTISGLEAHLVSVHKLVSTHRPQAVVMDPITGMTSVGEAEEIKSMLTRMTDYLKNQGITAVFTSLTEGGSAVEQSEVGISSLMDTWLLVRFLESEHERNRIIYVLKSRGMAHSNQMREFQLTDDGIDLLDVYVGPGTVLTGSARLAQEARDRTAELAETRTAAMRQRELTCEQAALRAQIEAMQSKLQTLSQETKLNAAQETARVATARQGARTMAASRKADRRR